MRTFWILGAIVHLVTAMLCGMSILLWYNKAFPNGDLWLLFTILMCASYVTALFYYFITLAPDYGKRKKELEEERNRVREEWYKLRELRQKYIDKIEKT